MAFEELKARQAATWSAAPYERIAAQAGDIQDDLLARLGVNDGESWLDLATGTGAVALRAARRGAWVTGQDVAPGMIETARRLAAEAGVRVRFDVGDCENLPYPDASFDVLSSAHGAIFGPDHAAVARELTRVCRPTGRIGLTAWRRGGAMEDLLSTVGRFLPPPPEGAGAPLRWGDRPYVRELLGDTFALEFFDGESPQLGESPEAVWELFSTAFGPIKVLAESLDEVRRRHLREAFVEYYEGYRVDGGVSAPREYLVIVGRRSGSH